MGSFASCPGRTWSSVEEVGVGVFDSVVFGERKPIGVRVVDGESKCGIRSAEFGICSRGDDGDELAEEVAFGAQVGGPLRGSGSPFLSYSPGLTMPVATRAE